MNKFFKALIIILFLSTYSFSQTIVVIDKNKDTAPLFDDVEPLSLISMLKSGLYHLGNFDLIGMNDSLVNTLTIQEKSKILKFAQMYHDYEYDENGEQRTVFNQETGMYDYVFIPPDTIYASLDNIERIVLNLSGGGLSKIHYIESIEFWKKYGGKLHKVLSLNPAILDLQGFKTIRPVAEEIQSFWLNKDDPKSLWNQMKEASLKVKRDYEAGVLSEENEFLMEFFPYHSDFPFDAYIGGAPRLVEEQVNSELNYLVVLNQDFNAKLPFQFSYGDSLNFQLDYNKKLESKFEEVVSISLISDEPILDMDPDSPNYLSELIIAQPDGTMEFVFPDPIIIYLWCDYNDIELFAVEEFVFDGNTDEMRTKIVGLCFTEKSTTGKPEIISYIQTDGKYSSFFENYPSEKLNELEWNKIFKKEIEKNANTYQLSDPKDIKRLEKRNIKVMN